MKGPIFVFILLLGSSVLAQRISNVFVDLGMNHSGFITHQKYGIDQGTAIKNTNDFRDNFNPNFSRSIGFELKLKNKLNLTTGLGYRTTGTFFKVPETTLQQPDGTGKLINVYYHLNQLTLPILIGYNFGEKFKLKPILGLVNNYNVSMKEKTENYNNNNLEKYYNKYTLNGLVGLMFYNEQLFSSKLGLGMKISYEKNLTEIDKFDNSITKQNILSGSMMLIYNLRKN